MFAFKSKILTLLLMCSSAFGQLDSSVSITNHRQISISQESAWIDKEGDTQLNTLGIGAAPITNSVLDITGSLSIKEQSSANTETTDWGQLWVKNTDPVELWFTDDVGTNFNIGAGGGTITGTGTLNFIPIWTAGNALGNSTLKVVSGDLGFDTITPVSKLDIHDNVFYERVTGAVLTLSNDLTVIVDGYALGRIDFRAPLESDGGDAILAGAAIWAEADDTFSATVNDTDLVFATGISESATEKMRLTSDGYLGINNDNPSHVLEVSDTQVFGNQDPAGIVPILHIEDSDDASINLVGALTTTVFFSDTTGGAGGEGELKYDQSVNNFWLRKTNSDFGIGLFGTTGVGIGDVAPSGGSFGFISPRSTLDVRGDDVPGTITLTNDVTVITTLDQAGRINFETPNELSFGVARSIHGSIWVEAVSDYTDIINDTDMIFAVGLSGDATEKMRLDPEGRLTIDSTIRINEISAALSSLSGSGQIWVKDTSPNELWFTDDNGSDFILGGVLGSDITGSGTAQKLSVFSGPQTISDSIIAQVSSDIGVNTVVPVSGFDIRDATITVSTSDTDVIATDILGQINFTAPDEASGTVALLPGASIWAEADATFSAGVNNTDLIFATGEAETAVEKMRLTSIGALGLGITPPANVDTGDMVLEGGAIVLKERVTPTADTNYAKIYSKTDNELYFQDGSGGETQISNTIVSSHSDTTATGTELTTLTDGSDSSALHVHTITSLDTTATGLELTELTDSSETTLHSHAGGGGDISGSGTVGTIPIFVTDTTTIGDSDITQSGTEIVLNEDGADLNFRVEASGAANAFFVEGSTGKISLGSASPDQQFHMDYTGASGSIRMRIENSEGFVDYATDNQRAVIFINNTTAVEIAGIAGQETVFNQNNVDVDFRVESDINTHALFVQGSDGHVGINTGTPTSPLHVMQSNPSAGGMPVLILDQAKVTAGFINFVGSDRGSVSGSVASVRVEINGTVYVIPMYADQ